MMMPTTKEIHQKIDRVVELLQRLRQARKMTEVQQLSTELQHARADLRQTIDILICPYQLPSETSSK